MPPFSIRAAGYLGNSDRPYLETINERVARWKQPDRFRYVGELPRAEKIAFLQGLDVMSLPTVYRESKGLSVLEAMANAVPVVLPAHGAFPEVIEQTGGGLLYDPQDPRALAAQLKRLLTHPAERAALGASGQQSVRRDFQAAEMAERTRELYQQVLAVRQIPQRSSADGMRK